MEKTTKYAQIRYQMAQLEAEAKLLEAEVLAELKEAGTKTDTTQYGKVQTVETKIFTYSDDFLNKKLMVETEIKNFADTRKAEIKELQTAEEFGQTPEVKVALRFSPAKEEN